MAKTVKKDEAAVKAAETVKTPVVAEEVKAAPKAAEAAPKAAKAPKAKKTAAAKAPKAEKAAKAPKAKKTATKAKTVKEPKDEKTASGVKVFVQYQGNEIAMDAIMEAVKAAAGVKRVKALEVYVKPEDGAAYYVVNGKDTGKVAL